MAKRKHSRRRRRRRATPEAPVVLRGTIPGERLVPRRLRSLAAPLEAAVRALPSYAPGDRGRARATAVRLVIGACAFGLVTLGRETIVLGLLGALVALSLLVLPLPDYRKRRWLAAARRLGEPRRVVTEVGATLRYDGTKLVIEREDGRTWKSVRPRHGPIDVAVVVGDDHVLLGLVKRGGRRREHVWLRAPRHEVRDTYDPVVPAGTCDTAQIPEACSLDGPSWAALHELLWDPTTGGLPKPKGPART